MEFVEELGSDIKEYPKHENNMLKSSEHIEYIDFIGTDEILYSYIPSNVILKELQDD